MLLLHYVVSYDVWSFHISNNAIWGLELNLFSTLVKLYHLCNLMFIVLCMHVCMYRSI